MGLGGREEGGCGFVHLLWDHFNSINQSINHNQPINLAASIIYFSWLISEGTCMVRFEGLESGVGQMSALDYLFHSSAVTSASFFP